MCDMQRSVTFCPATELIYAQRSYIEPFEYEKQKKHSSFVRSYPEYNPLVTTTGMLCYRHVVSTKSVNYFRPSGHKSNYVPVKYRLQGSKSDVMCGAGTRSGLHLILCKAT